MYPFPSRTASPPHLFYVPHIYRVLLINDSHEAKQGLGAFLTPITVDEVTQLRNDMENLSKLSERYITRRQVILRELNEIVTEVLDTGIPPP
jgi:hypothetical protein